MKRIYIPSVLIMCALLLTGCGKAASCTENDEYLMAETAAAAAFTEEYSGGGVDIYSSYYEETAAEAKSYGTDGSDETGLAETAAPEQTGRKLIRTINISIQTENFDSVTEGIIADVEKYGGYIENSDVYLGGYNNLNNRNASICVRIPADKCNEFLSRSYENTYVEYRSENTEDVSLKYSDLETRLSTLEAERDRLQELIREAEDVDSLVVLEQRLSEIRYELESIHSNLKNYDNKVDYTTVWIYINEVQKAEPPAEAGFGERIKDGFERSTEALGNALEDFAVWFISNILTILLVLVLIGIHVLIVLAIVRGVKKRNLAKKQKILQETERDRRARREETAEEKRTEDTGSGE